MKILLVAWYNDDSPKAVLEHIRQMKEKSRHEVSIYNAYRRKFDFRKLFIRKIDSYDCVIFHNTISYTPQAVFALNNKFHPRLSDFNGLKVLMKQDEMRKINETKKLIDSWGINILTTCLDAENSRKVYGETLNGIKVIKTYTGYLSEELKKYPRTSLKDRPLDVVYRGMVTPYYWGRLGHEKFYIGEVFKKYSNGKQLKIDISSKTEDRIYGKNWFRFLSSSKATLAVESGASVFDFDGKIEQAINEYVELNPQATFEEVFERFLVKADGLIKYNQISPRHLEAVALGTVQIMFEGEYNDIFIPDRHYISLKKDFSNYEEVIAKLQDTPFCENLVQNSLDEVLTRKDLVFDDFIKQLDDAIESLR